MRIVNPARIGENEWGVWIQDWKPKAGDKVRVKTQSGKEWIAILTERAAPHKWRTKPAPKKRNRWGRENPNVDMAHYTNECFEAEMMDCTEADIDYYD